MGISTYQSYCGAQIFDAVGLQSDFVDKYFFGTATTIEGVGLEEIAEETVRATRDAFGDAPVYRTALEVGGEYAYRIRGEDHVWTPDTVATLQHAVRRNAQDRYREFARARERAGRASTTPSAACSSIKTAEERGRAARAARRGRAGGDDRQALLDRARCRSARSRSEAHETLAIAMNQIGGKSNTGEGGEEADRYVPLPDGRTPKRSAIKQVASGRFGVTAEYLVNADMMQIKMAQGAKPGEGGQLPGHKVDADDRQGAPLDAGRRPDLAAAAPRHLLDRGSGAAHLRPEERQPGG